MSRSGMLALLASLALGGCACGSGPGPDAGIEDASSVEDARAPLDAGETVELGDDARDRDGDGVVDLRDAFPDDPAEAFDSDGDGIGNAVETDEDGDGAPDVSDAAPFDPTTSSARDAASAEPDEAAATAAGALPVRLVGRIDPATDVDRFAIELGAGARLGARAFAPVRLSVGPAGGATWRVLDALDRLALITPEAGPLVHVSAHAAADYVVSVFEDRDADHADDARELALGCDPERRDSDRDGLFDGDELYAPDGTLLALDPDADGLPTFRDPDSDGDGLPDAVEGAGDPDRDGLPSFVDGDSDGDGTPDAEQRADTDLDGVEDAIDLDDDADGLLDANDADDLVPLEPADPLTTVVTSHGTELGGELAAGVAHPDGTFVIEGRGLAGAPADTWLVLRAVEGPPHDVRPGSITDTRVEAELPDVEIDAVALVVGALRTGWLPVVGARRGEPVVTSMPSAAAFGEEIAIRGANLGGVLFVEMPTAEAAAVEPSRFITPSSVSATEVRFVVPTLAVATGPVTLLAGTDARTPAGDLVVRRPATIGSVVLPAGSSLALTDLVVEGADGARGAVSDTGLASTEVSFLRAQVVSVLVPTPGEMRDTVLLQAVADGAFVETIDVTTTAVALAAQLSGGLDRVAPRDVSSALARAAALPEVVALAAALDAALATDPRALEAPDAALADRLAAASRAFATEILGDSTAAPVVEPGVITPPEAYGVRVSERADPHRGNVTIDNDTSLYLSARLVDRETDRVLVEHVSGFFDPAMIGSQSGSLTLFRSNEADLDQPRFRNARIEIVSAGALSRLPAGADRLTRDAYFYVGMRSFVDKVILNAVSHVLGRVIPGDQFMHAIVHSFSDVLQAARDTTVSGSPTAGWSLLLTAMRNDFENLGPFTRLLARLVGRAGLDAAVRRLATLLTPLIGELAAAIELIGAGSTVLNVGAYAADVVVTPPRFDFDASWQLGVERVVPSWVIPSGQDEPIHVVGARFEPEQPESGAPILPRVTFSNDTAGEVEVVPTRIWPTGDRMEVVLPGAYLLRARDTIHVRVDHRGQTAMAPSGIRTTRSLVLDAIDPPGGLGGDVVTLRGGVFTGSGDRVAVHFSNRADLTDPSRVVLRAEVLETTTREIRVVVPREVVGTPGDTWVVWAEIGPIGASADTNTRPFSIMPPGLWFWRWNVEPGVVLTGRLRFVPGDDWTRVINDPVAGPSVAHDATWNIMERGGTPESLELTMWIYRMGIPCCDWHAYLHLRADLVSGTFTGTAESGGTVTGTITGARRR